MIIWGVLYLLGCILWFCHPCQHQSHGGSYSSAVNLPSYTCPLAHELDHLWTYYSCTLFDGCGYSKPSRGGNCLASPSAAVALCTWVSPSIWLFWAWYWVRGWTGTGECVLCCFNSLYSWSIGLTYYWESLNSNVGFVLLCFPLTYFVDEIQAEVTQHQDDFVSNMLLLPQKP